MRNVLVALVVLASTSARAKPKVAILGLESSSKDAMEVATELTLFLRDRPRVGSSAYVLAPSSNREQIDMKLLANCANEAPACMAKIGADLGADVLVYGRVDKADGGYRVHLKLLDVKQRALTHALDDTMDTADTTGAKLAGWAKRAYTKLLP
jgi:hypothetical protein